MHKQISLNQIKKAARKVVSKIHPEQVILFGSYAYGKPTSDSDVDFLLVINKGNKNARQKMLLKASKALDPRPFPIDLIVKSKSEIKSRVAQGDFFLQDIVENGQILYKR